MSDIGYLGNFDLKHEVKILVLNPVAPGDRGEGPLTLATQKLLAKSTHVDEAFCRGGPISIDDSKTARAAAPLVVERARWAQEQGYDAILVNCMLDPGVDEARGAVSIPVIGLKQAAYSIALLVGGNPAFFDPESLKVEEYGADPENTFNLLLDSGRRKVNFQGADVLIPNCTYLGGLAGALQDELDVPVLANRDIALKVVELIANFRLKPEAKWVAEGRSKTKIFLTKLYQVPLVGPVLYRIARAAGGLRGVVLSSKQNAP